MYSTLLAYQPATARSAEMRNGLANQGPVNVQQSAGLQSLAVRLEKAVISSRLRSNRDLSTRCTIFPVAARGMS